VSAPDRGTAVLPADYASRHVELGWAVTGYGNQGDTVDVGIAVIEPGTNRNNLYVAMTRGREANHAWVRDETGDRDPVDVLHGVLAHEADRGSALSVADRLYREAGLPTPELGIGREVGFGREPDWGR
jgi:hypothetical protein